MLLLSSLNNCCYVVVACLQDGDVVSRAYMPIWCHVTPTTSVYATQIAGTSSTWSVRLDSASDVTRRRAADSMTVLQMMTPHDVTVSRQQLLAAVQLSPARRVTVQRRRSQWRHDDVSGVSGMLWGQPNGRAQQAGAAGLNTTPERSTERRRGWS